MKKTKQKHQYRDESINKISWSISKEYTAQSVLIDIYTQFLFSAHLFFPQERFVSQSSAIKGLTHPSWCSGYDSFIKKTKQNKHWHVIHGCAHWILTPWFRFTWPFVHGSIQKLRVRMPPRRRRWCLNVESQRPRSGGFSAAVPETLSTSGTPGARR